MKPAGRLLLIAIILTLSGCTTEPPFRLAEPPTDNAEPLRCDQTPRSPITFAGLEWQVSAGQSAGQACWSAGQQSISVFDDHLYLRFQQLYGIWHGAQITTTDPIQPGIHCFTLASPVDSLDPNLRARLSLVASDGHQIAVEFGGLDSALYLMRSPDADLYRRSFQIDPDATTHCIDWRADDVTFWSLIHRPDGMLTEQLRDSVSIPPGTDQFHLQIDLSLIDGQSQPLVDAPAELIVTDLTYTEACPLPGSMLLTAPAHGTYTTANQPLLQWEPTSDADLYLVEGFTQASEPVFRAMTADFEYLPPELLDGNYVWRVQAFATANGCYMPGLMSAAYQITVDSHAPTFSNPTSTDDPSQGGLFSMTLEIADPISGVQAEPQFYYRFGAGEINERQNDGMVIGSWNGTAYEASFTLDPSYNGESIYWQVKARDHAGNIGWSEVYGGRGE